MVNIPTTDRKYYNNTEKVNTLAAYAGALNDAFSAVANTYKEIKENQEAVKIDTFQTEAQLRLNDVETQWRQKYINDPTNADGLKELQEQRQSILDEYGSQIDPIAKQKWNSVARSLNSKYELSNQNWAIKQNQDNSIARMKLNMQNNYKLVNSLAANGDYEGAMAQLEQGYNQTLNAGARLIGVDQAALMLNEYQEKGVESIIYGIASTDPNKAMDLLKNNEKVKALLGDDAVNVSKKIVNSMITQFNYDRKVSEYNTQLECLDAIDKADTAGSKIGVLQQYEGVVPDKFYKNQMKALMRNAGITNKTQEDAYADLFEESIAKYDDDFQAIKGRTDLINKIEETYANGLLKLSDKRSLIKNITKERQSNIEALKEKKDENFLWGWDVGEMIDVAKKMFPDKKDFNKAVYNYQVALGDNSDADLSDTERKKIAQKVFKDLEAQKVNDAIDKVRNKVIGKKIGKFKIVGVR